MRPLRGPIQWVVLLLIIGAVVAMKYAAFTPWALHIGGRSTPGRQWDGLGDVEASNGGRYVLFTHLEGGIDNDRYTSHGSGGTTQQDNLHGTAELCTRSGAVHTFKLAGVIKSWRSTDGAKTSIRLTGGTPVRLPGGWDVALHGVWHGPELELASPDNSFTEVFTPRGEIRHVTSTADAGTARVTLHYGTHDEFAAACRGLHD
jgi:hypothetical protein